MPDNTTFATERTGARQGYGSGYWNRPLNAWVAQTVLSIPQGAKSGFKAGVWLMSLLLGIAEDRNWFMNLSE